MAQIDYPIRRAKAPYRVVDLGHFNMHFWANFKLLWYHCCLINLMDNLKFSILSVGNGVSSFSVCEADTPASSICVMGLYIYMYNFWHFCCTSMYDFWHFCRTSMGKLISVRRFSEVTFFSCAYWSFYHIVCQTCHCLPSVMFKDSRPWILICQYIITKICLYKFDPTFI